MKIRYIFLSLMIVNVCRGEISTRYQSLKPLVDSWKSFRVTQFLTDIAHDNIPLGSTILQLGSNWMSQELSKYYTVYSIEYDAFWGGRFGVNCIQVPLIEQWFDAEKLKSNLPGHYDAIWLSVPPAMLAGFFNNLNLFDTSKPLIFDKNDRKGDEIAGILKKKIYRIHYQNDSDPLVMIIK